MIWDVLAWIGLIVCIIGVSIIILLGLMTVREFIIDNFYEWKLTKVKQGYEYDVKVFTLIHLRQLKKKYPELEIHYNGEELQEWGDD